MTDKELLQQALDVLETLIVYSWNGGKKGEPDKAEDYSGVKIVEAIKARLTQPDGVILKNMEHPTGAPVDENADINATALEHIEIEIDKTGTWGTKEWVGLTDADWIIGKRSADYIAGAEWAETKLKEKNNG